MSAPGARVGRGAVRRTGRRRPLSLTVPAGRMLAITGPSGAGKTSLLWLMAGALEADRGTRRVDGSPVGDRPEAAARGIAVVPQGNGLAAVLTAYENIVVPLLDGGRVGRRGGRAGRARRSTVVGLEEWASTWSRSSPAGSSSGSRWPAHSRPRPRLLLADEPTSDLDGRNREVVMAALRAIADRGAVVVLATHDPEAAAAADGELALDAGVATWVRSPEPVDYQRTPSRCRSSGRGAARTAARGPGTGRRSAPGRWPRRPSG